MKRAWWMLALAACADPRPMPPVPAPAPPGIAATPTVTAVVASPPSRARVVLTANRDAFHLGENVLVHYCLENTSSGPLTIEVGGDYRGSSRSLRFQVTVTGEDGKVVADPDPKPFNMGGIGYTPAIQPGESWCQSLPLLRYARIHAPGSYRVRVVHDLGWKTEPPPAGELKLRFAMPSPREAELVIGTMRRLPDDPDSSAGEKSVDWADFTTLSHAVYLAPLDKLARTAFVPAVAGIGSIPTPDATRALIRLASHPSPPVARAAAEELSMRLPDPALEGALGPRNVFFNELPEQRKFLVARSWRPDMADDVRSLARQHLSSTDDEELKSGAFFLEAVGEPADARHLAPALGLAIDKTRTTPRETGIYPVPRGAAQELLRAAEILVRLGHQPTSTRTSGELALWLVSVGRGARPTGWEATLAGALAHPIAYLREIALTHTPYAAAFDKALRANLSHRDPDVLIAACRLVERNKLVKLAPDVLAILGRADSEWLLRIASSTLAALDVHSPRYQALAARLDDAAVNEVAIGLLLDLFATSGSSRSGAIPPEMAKALEAKWLRFLRARQPLIDAAQKLSLDDAPRDLVPPGWKISRNGKPDWP
jgi:hypothetical protein